MDAKVQGGGDNSSVGVERVPLLQGCLFSQTEIIKVLLVHGPLYTSMQLYIDIYDP